MHLLLYWPPMPILNPRALVPLRPGGILLALVFALALGGGCPQRGRVNTLPPLELATSPDPRAEADFRAAQKARSEGRYDEAERRLKAFLEVYPQDPLAPFARLELGRLEIERGRPQKARPWLDEAEKAEDPAIVERARMYNAVAAQRLGQHEHALAILRPLVGRTVDPKETALVLDTLAAAEQAIGDDLSALRTRDRELAGELPEAQRAQVERMVRDMVQKLDPALELPRAYEMLPRSGFAWPEVARRLLRVSHERGERSKVAEIADALRDERIELDPELAALVLQAERPRDADPGLVGAILPLSGRGREVGETVLQGLLLASSVEEGAHPRLVYRDDAGDPERALEALEDLVSVHRVIAVIGPVSAASAQAVAERADGLDVPVLALSPDPSLTQRADTVFRCLPEPREEAEALLQRAQRAGARRFALLHPDGPFGQAMLQAFQTAVRSVRGELYPVAYPPSTTNFVREAEQVARLAPDAVILADAPGRVTLMAPALAAAGLWSLPRGERPPEGRAVTYLVPSAGFDPSLARTARRYLQGALFAVPFDAQAPSAFTEAYRERYQSEPNLFAAAAYDAFRLIEAGIEAGADTRAELARELTQVHVPDSATSVGAFAPDRKPRTPVRVHTLMGEAFVRVD